MADERFFASQIVWLGDKEQDSDVGIPIVRIEDLVTPVFEYFGLEFRDERIIDKATDYLSELASSADVERMRQYLWIDPLINVNNLKFAVAFSSLEFKLLEARPTEDISTWKEIPTKWSRWIAAQGNLILKIAEITKIEDNSLQHWLNYEDFILELTLTQEGRKIITQVYDLRGLDFFLFHYMGGRTSALEDKAMFESAQEVVKALKSMGRLEEAISVAKDLKDRENGFACILQDFRPTKSYPDGKSHSVIEILRLKGERFWNECLGTETWRALSVSSRNDLVDAFVSEFFLKKEVLRNWCQVILALCKVIEREMALSLFQPWIEQIRSSDFIISSSFSKAKSKKAKSRRRTYEVLRKCTSSPIIHSPTLGQMAFIVQFLDDLIMDECTDLFSIIRTELNSFCSESSLDIQRLSQFLNEPHRFGNEEATIVKLRNASAHPGKEQEFSWSQYVEWLKKILAEPPYRILERLVVHLRKPIVDENVANAPHQVAVGEGASAQGQSS